MKEIWKPVIGLEDWYLISNKGNVKRIKKNMGTSTGIIFPHKTRYGYLRIMLRKNGKYYQKLVHRLVAVSFIPNPENKPCVNHKNGIRTDNAINNLEWCTYSENTNHAFNVLGRKASFGRTNGRAKLNDDQVREIKRLLKKGELLQKEIGNKFGVSPGTISCINRNRTWRHIDG